MTNNHQTRKLYGKMDAYSFVLLMAVAMMGSMMMSMMEMFVRARAAVSQQMR